MTSDIVSTVLQDQPLLAYLALVCVVVLWAFFIWLGFNAWDNWIARLRIKRTNRKILRGKL